MQKIKISDEEQKAWNEHCKSIAIEKTKDWVIGETGFRFLGTGFVWCFQGIDEDGFVLGKSWERKTKKTEYFRHQMTELGDIRKRTIDNK